MKLIHKKIVDEWFKNGFSAYKAYLKFRPLVKKASATKLSSDLFKQDDVKKYIQQKRDKMEKKEEIELSYLIDKLKYIIEDVMSESIERDSSSNRILSKPDRASAIKAIDILAKLAGAYTNKVDITTGGESLNMKDLIQFDNNDIDE